MLAAQLATTPGALDDDVLRASTAFGQGELQVTPLSMALVVATIVNGGDMPRPHLLLHNQTPGGRQYGEPSRAPWIPGVIRPETADQAEQIMIAAVEAGGWRQPLRAGCRRRQARPSLAATGPHAWFIGFASDGARSVAIAVLVEHGGSGANGGADLRSGCRRGFAPSGRAGGRALSSPSVVHSRSSIAANTPFASLLLWRGTVLAEDAAWLTIMIGAQLETFVSNACWGEAGWRLSTTGTT